MNFFDSDDSLFWLGLIALALAIAVAAILGGHSF